MSVRAQALGLSAIKLTAPSVLVTGNSALADVSALARLAGCASGNPTGTNGIVLEVHPAGQALKCTLVAWKQVCDYIAADNQARSPGQLGNSSQRKCPPLAVSVLACSVCDWYIKVDLYICACRCRRTACGATTASASPHECMHPPRA